MRLSGRLLRSDFYAALGNISLAELSDSDTSSSDPSAKYSVSLLDITSCQTKRVHEICRSISPCQHCMLQS